MFKKTLALLLAVVMLLAVTPVLTFAERSVERAVEERAYRRMDQAWAELEAVEAEMLSKKATPAQTVKAAYEAALKSDKITDVVWQDDNGFQFLVDGMANAYDYRIRNSMKDRNVSDEVIKTVTEATKGSSTSNNVLLIGPCYSTDSSFTDQYQNEATSIKNATGGTLTTLLNSNASATNIVNAFPNNGVVIFDSHGASYYSTSYLCLTTSTGISSSDYTNQWALNFGSGTYGIDGRFIRNYISSSLPNSIVWMAICEGMMTSVFGEQLTAAGAGIVYGYSQSVTFTGDYAYEEIFWDEMRDGATVASAIATMKSQKGYWDPAYSNYSFSSAVSNSVAFPVVVSDVDAYPSDPDNYQTVNCTWKLIGDSTVTPTAEPTVAPTSTPITGDYEFVKATSIEAGAEYLITYTYSSTPYVLTTTLYNSSNARYPRFAAATVTANGSGYDIAMSTTTYGSDVNTFLYTAGGNSTSGWTFYNDSLGKYLAFDSSGYPTFATSGLIEWTYSNGSLRNTDYSADSYIYAGFNTSYKYLGYSSSAVTFTF